MLWKSLATVVIVAVVGGLMFLISLPESSQAEKKSPSEREEMCPLEKKLNEIEVSLDCRNSSLEEVVEFLRLKVVENERGEGENRGISYVVRSPRTREQQAETYSVEDGLGGDGESTREGVTRITLKLDKVTIAKALDFVCEASGMHWKIDENVVVILPKEVEISARKSPEIDPNDPFSGSGEVDAEAGDDPFGC